MKNKLKKRMISMMCLLIIGLLSIIVSYFYTGNTKDYLNGFGCGMSLFTLIIIIKLYIQTKDQKKLKKLEIEENDERNKKLMITSMAFSFRISILLQSLGCIVCAFLKQITLSETIAIVLSIQLMIYILVYIILSKKM